MRNMPARLSVFLILAACAGSSTSSEGAAPAPAADSGAAGASSGMQVVIDNQNINDVNVYLIGSGGGRVLVGKVASGKKTTLTIPQSVTPASARVTLVADPGAGGQPISTPPTVVPGGQRLYWKIGSDQSMSTSSTGE